MIAATFDPQETAFRKYFFRGEDLFYWSARIFKGIPFFRPEEVPRDFRLAVIFNFSKFLAIDPGQVTFLIRYFQRHITGQDILSLPGNPFFVLPRTVLENAKLTISKGICSIAARTGCLKLIKLKNNCPVWDLRSHLPRTEKQILNYQIAGFLKDGVVIEDYSNFYIDGKVMVGRGSRIGSGVVIRGNSRIGKNVAIYSGSYIENTAIADDCTVLPHCVLRDSVLEKNVQVGPFTHLRDNSIVQQGAKTGNFVELKKSRLGRGSKAMHLSYIGDATIGKQANIGAGTITCNYDGEKKHPTTIGDHVFVGSGTELVAPLEIGRNSYIGAGSTITDYVPPDSLAIARGKQVTKPGWIKKKGKKKV